MVFAAAACGLWMVLAALLFRGGRCPSNPLRLALALSGVPLLGVVTYLQGPLVGLFALACGTLVLSRQHLPRLFGAGRGRSAPDEAAPGRD